MAEIGNQIWSGRIVDAHYTNPEHDTVEILYRQVHPDEPSGTDADIKKEFYLKKGNIEKYKFFFKNKWITTKINFRKYIFTKME
mgnify:CR=1 FL=1